MLVDPAEGRKKDQPACLPACLVLCVYPGALAVAAAAVVVVAPLIGGSK